MTLNVLNLRPDSQGYAITMASSTLLAQVDGGSPRTRAGTLNPWTTMTVRWTGDNDEYEYLQQCYRYTEANGGAHFLLDLYMSHGFIVQHECMFVPGSFGLVSQQGTKFVVQANILVRPSPGEDATWPADSTFQGSILTDEVDHPLMT